MSNFVAMKLRTEIDIKPLERSIDYTSRLFMIGSCFAQNIGERVVRAKFRATVNPTGTLFNPISIVNTLERLSQRRHIAAEQLRSSDMGWYHYDFHSSLSGSSEAEAIERINRAIDLGGEALQSSDWVVMTLGTAWVYRVDDGAVVANCHKEPAKSFRRERLTSDEIAERLLKCIDEHLADKDIIFTISPIRHLGDGLVENSLSKATLRLAVEQIVAQRPHSTHYFPSFEIMMDDLRDYRFYADDMLHPTPLAVEYIWDIFTQTAISSGCRTQMELVMRVVRAAEHRAINPSSAAHKRHCEAQLRAIEQLPMVDLSEESRYFGEQLKINL